MNNNLLLKKVAMAAAKNMSDMIALICENVDDAETSADVARRDVDPVPEDFGPLVVQAIIGNETVEKETDAARIAEIPENIGGHEITTDEVVDELAIEFPIRHPEVTSMEAFLKDFTYFSKIFAEHCRYPYSAIRYIYKQYTGYDAPASSLTAAFYGKDYAFNVPVETRLGKLVYSADDMQAIMNNILNNNYETVTLPVHAPGIKAKATGTGNRPTALESSVVTSRTVATSGTGLTCTLN